MGVGQGVGRVVLGLCTATGRVDAGRRRGKRELLTLLMAAETQPCAPRAKTERVPSTFLAISSHILFVSIGRYPSGSWGALRITTPLPAAGVAPAPSDYGTAILFWSRDMHRWLICIRAKTRATWSLVSHRCLCCFSN